MKDKDEQLQQEWENMFIPLDCLMWKKSSLELYWMCDCKSVLGTIGNNYEKLLSEENIKGVVEQLIAEYFKL